MPEKVRRRLPPGVPIKSGVPPTKLSEITNVGDYVLLIHNFTEYPCELILDSISQGIIEPKEYFVKHLVLNNPPIDPTDIIPPYTPQLEVKKNVSSNPANRNDPNVEHFFAQIGKVTQIGQTVGYVLNQDHLVETGPFNLFNDYFFEFLIPSPPSSVADISINVFEPTQVSVDPPFDLKFKKQVSDGKIIYQFLDDQKTLNCTLKNLSPTPVTVKIWGYL